MRFTRVLCFTLMSLFTVSALAAEGKIAVIDFGQAIFSSDVAKARLKQLKAASDYASLEAKRESTIADMKALQKNAESKRMTWSQEEAAEFQKKMEYLRADLDLTGRKLQQEQKTVQGSILQELRPKAGEALQELLAEEGVALLLNAEAVITVVPELDLTSKLTDRLNKKTK